MGHDDGKPEHPKRCYEGGRLELNVKLGSGMGGALRKRLVLISI